MPKEFPETLRNGAIATTVVITIAVSRSWSRGDEVVYFWTMIAAVLVGILGFGFHLSADLAGTGQLSLERILAFAPVFAPLLFSNLGVLGLLVVAQPHGEGGDARTS